MTEISRWRRAYNAVERNAHFVDGMWASMAAIGLSDELALPEA